ncbi:cation diffusion facilitator family transporter [Rubinisphaera sp.]|uniref:cation diffusion facilitator family transporter n=1 Tax=Rubinisphaera sp. TaxID=2024857 RepID=UPI000C0F0D0B|nr:cation diffusion facilitator family transporter [Rubinisphaera sp.]MBV11211.1 cation transporter [Rubinisphaera sp.]HCS50319.1 cation transporter [Planctomycetaceae bacterium]|tara:strand:+ start:11787 stop:12752 length:966 start_codon:yes stop_codon:yes gene_type:complete
MAASGSKLAIYGAIVGNFLICITKFIAAGLTGSSAMLTEGIHSLVDTGNGGLLLFGIHRSERIPDEKHPFGYGPELYFWTLIVGILIFGIGGGISVYEGILHVLHPIELSDPTVNYIVLGLAVIFEGAAWYLALKGFLVAKGNNSVWKAVKESKDPTTFAVLFEDSAALLGLIVAFLGIFIGHLLEIPVLDGVASICIGLILAAVAFVLIYESHGLLIGESASPEIVEGVRQIVNSYPEVQRAKSPLTLHFGPNQILLAMDLQFLDSLGSDQIESTIDRIESEIRKKYPEIRNIFLEADAILISRRTLKLEKSSQTNNSSS